MKAMVGGCCVCSDERGWAENPLVYCDGNNCSVAVHQACYGIVQVPKGPWFCRKCESQERVARVKCELCPQKEGALKRADTGWCHVICALFIPEAWFANVQTMEPIVLKNVPQERFNKTCYICDENSKESRSTSGACMQCNKNGCKQHFHVTCAQAYGLLCEEAGSYGDNVKYCGYCSYHNKKLKKDANIKIIPAFRPIQLSESSTPESSPEKGGSKVENKDKLKTKDKKLDNSASSSSDSVIHLVSNSLTNQTSPQKSPSSVVLMNNSDSSSSIASPTGFPGFTEADIKSATSKQKEEHFNSNNNNSKSQLNSVNLSIDGSRTSPKHNSLNLGSGEPKIIMNARLSVPVSDGAYKLNPNKGPSPLSSNSSTTSSLTLPSNSQSSAQSRAPHPTNFGSSLAEMSCIASSILANESLPTCTSKRKQNRAEKRAKKSKTRSQSVGSQEEVMMLKLTQEGVTSSSSTNSSSNGRRRSSNAAVAVTSQPGTSTPAGATAGLGSNSNLNVFGGSPCFQTPISITSLTKQEPVEATSSSISSSASSSSASLLFGPSKQASTSLAKETFPASMEELLERQWEQGAQFLMEQGQHFDIAALLTCLHQLKNETNNLQESIQTLSARRDRLLAINARLSIPFSGTTENSTDSASQNSPVTPTDPLPATTSSRPTLAANKQGSAGNHSSAGTSTGDKSAGQSTLSSQARDLPNGAGGGGGGKCGSNKSSPSSTHPNPAVSSPSSFLPYPVTPSPILHGVHAGVSSSSPISQQLTSADVKGSPFPPLPGIPPHMLLDAQFQHFLASKALAASHFNDQPGHSQFVYPGLLSGHPPLGVNLPHPSSAAAILSNMQQHAYPPQVSLASQNPTTATSSKSSSSSSSSSSSNKGKGKDKR